MTNLSAMGLAVSEKVRDLSPKFQIVEAMVGIYHARLVITTERRLVDEEKDDIKELVDNLRPAAALIDLVFEEFVV